MPTVRSEVEKLLGDMMIRARELDDPVKERETTEIATIVLSQAIPQSPEDMPAGLISARARAILSHGWMAYANKRLSEAT